VGGAKIAAVLRSTRCSRNYMVDLERVAFVSGFVAEPAAVLLGQHLFA